MKDQKQEKENYRNAFISFTLAVITLVFAGIYKCNAQDDGELQVYNSTTGQMEWISIDSLEVGTSITHPQSGTMALYDTNTDDWIKQEQFRAHVGTFLAISSYMVWVENQEVHIGWRFVMEESKDEGREWSMSSNHYYAETALDYVQLYEFSHDYLNSRLYYDSGVHELEPENYWTFWKARGVENWIRAERIMKPMKPSFQGFYDWAFNVYLKEYE